MRFAALLILLLASALAQAEVYRWVDRDGHKHYADKKPADVDAETVVLRPEPEPVAPAPEPARAPTRPAPAAERQRYVPDVVMYTSKGCGWCARARTYFNNRGIGWREVDIDGSKRDYEDFKRQGGKGTPLIFIDGTRVSGFDRARLDSVLRQLGA